MTLLVAGSLHLDVVVNAPHLPQTDETVTGDAVAYAFGGKGGNQAVAAARHGAQVAFVGRIGGDEFGRMMRGALDTAGVDCAGLQQDDGASGMSVAIVDAQGDYGAVIVSAANLRIDVENVTIPAQTRLLLLQNEVPEAVNLALAAKARAMGAQVWLNAAPARDLSAEMLALVDLMIVNRGEAAFYGDALGPKVLTTLGAEGLMLEGRQHPGFLVKAVSSHGAGDCFVGALAARVLAGDAMADALTYAQAAAALHVSLPVAERAAVGPAQVAAFRAGRVQVRR